MQFHLTRQELEQRKKEQELAKLERLREQEAEGNPDAVAAEEARKKKEAIAAK